MTLESQVSTKLGIIRANSVSFGVKLILSNLSVHDRDKLLQFPRLSESGTWSILDPCLAVCPHPHQVTFCETTLTEQSNQSQISSWLYKVMVKIILIT